jgi:hypothetical protein
MLALGLVAILGVAACKDVRNDDRSETGTRTSADTVVTEREMRDTTIVRHDTTITADTIRKRGTKAVDTDTIKD